MGMKSTGVMWLWLAWAAVADAAPPPAPTDRERELQALVVLAEAPGDLMSDALLVERLRQLGGYAAPRDAAPELAQRFESLQARRARALGQMTESLQSSAMASARLLSRDACFRAVTATDAACAEKRQALEFLASGNAYYHLVLARQAWHARDDAAYVRHLRAAAAATRYDDGFSDAFGSMHQRLQKAKPRAPAGFFQSEEQMAFWATVLVIEHDPMMDGVLAPCREVADTPSPIRDACHAVAVRMLEGAQTGWTRAEAGALINRLGTDREKAAFAAQTRRLQWWNWVFQSRLEDVRDSQQFDVLLREYAADVAAYGEIGAIEAAIRRWDVSLEPPPAFDPGEAGMELAVRQAAREP